MSDSEKLLLILSKTQIDFIEDELGITKEQIEGMDDAAVLDMYDKICDIEIYETYAAESRGGKYSDRELMAEGIVTVVGNKLYRPDQDEFEDEDE